MIRHVLNIDKRRCNRQIVVTAKVLETRRYYKPRGVTSCFGWVSSQEAGRNPATYLLVNRGVAVALEGVGQTVSARGLAVTRRYR